MAIVCVLLWLMVITELGLTTLVLSERVGMSQQQLSRYERGQNKISLSHLVNIATCMKTPISWFFIERVADYPLMKLLETRETYVTITEQDLSQRFGQLWSSLTTEKKKAVILLLDKFSN
jgi:transcriptional regulator with XRE-family HTH domain